MTTFQSIENLPNRLLSATVVGCACAPGTITIPNKNSFQIPVNRKKAPKTNVDKSLFIPNAPTNVFACHIRRSSCANAQYPLPYSLYETQLAWLTLGRFRLSNSTLYGSVRFCRPCRFTLRAAI